MGMSNEEEIFTKNFAHLLREKMWDKGLKVKDVASSAGFSSQSVSRYLTGERMPTLYSAKKLADAVGCKLDDFLEKEEMPTDNLIRDIEQIPVSVREEDGTKYVPFESIMEAVNKWNKEQTQ